EEWLLDAYGHDDFMQPVDVHVKRHARQRYTRKHLWVAYPTGADPLTATPEDAVGYAHLALPLEDNTHLCEVGVVVRRVSRRRGVATALAGTVRDALRGSGRTTIGCWFPNPLIEPDHPGALAPKTGVGLVDRTQPGAAWLLGLGFELEQGERYSTLVIPEDRASWLTGISRLRLDAAAVAGPDYDIVQWRGITPEPWRERMAMLHTRMSVDAPSAGFDFREEKWDVERVVHRGEVMLEADQSNVFTAIRHRPTGELVAYTEMQWPNSKPYAVYQEDTLVHGEHRGRRLGMLAKSANLEYLIAANPAAARLHTWNAAENRYMLAINEALGFRPAAIEGAWQKVVDPL
ncbi:MAG: N-acetyltransferase, partial [Actinomycetes bacterium]|nr:N-acetyltransferase [Actinomycetes bacterium]MDX5399372.1 N-acetyltransferase [Actinomycetes bacterium]MDX5450243.1 N-acetyltransferase [Actinomycetes bacterium]